MNMITINPRKRITIEDALDHRYFKWFDCIGLSIGRKYKSFEKVLRKLLFYSICFILHPAIGLGSFLQKRDRLKYLFLANQFLQCIFADERRTAFFLLSDCAAVSPAHIRLLLHHRRTHIKLFPCFTIIFISHTRWIFGSGVNYRSVSGLIEDFV